MKRKRYEFVPPDPKETVMTLLVFAFLVLLMAGANELAKFIVEVVP